MSQSNYTKQCGLPERVFTTIGHCRHDFPWLFIVEMKVTHARIDSNRGVWWVEKSINMEAQKGNDLKWNFPQKSVFWHIIETCHEYWWEFKSWDRYRPVSVLGKPNTRGSGGPWLSWVNMLYPGETEDGINRGPTVTMSLKVLHMLGAIPTPLPPHLF